MDAWQKSNQGRFLSLTIEKEGDAYCCIALTNPSEVILVDGGDYETKKARVKGGKLQVE